MTRKPNLFPLLWALALGAVLAIPAQAEAARPSGKPFIGIKCVNDQIVAIWPGRKLTGLTWYTGGTPGGGPYKGGQITAKDLPLKVFSCDDLRYELEFEKAKPGDIFGLFTYPKDSAVYVSYHIRLIERPANAGPGWY